MKKIDLVSKKLYAGRKWSEIKEKINRLGLNWRYEHQRETYNKYPFIYISLDVNRKDILVNLDVELDKFINSYYREISVEEFLNTEEKREDVVLQPFQKVLVRDTCKGKWTAAFFSHMERDTRTDYPYRCVGGIFAEAIPYEGNEDKLGKITD